jgi:hypothetical protein
MWKVTCLALLAFAGLTQRADAKQNAPTTTSVTPNNGPAAGAITITLAGNGFRNEQFTVDYYENGVLKRASDGVYVSNTSVTTVLPAGVGAGIAVRVNFSNTAMSNAVFFSYDKPEITSLSPSSAYADGTSFVIEVNGKNFGPASQSKAPTVSIGSMQCNTSTYVSDSKMNCTWNTLMDDVQQRVSVTAGDQTSATASSVAIFRFMPVPQISTVYPNMGETNGGEVLTVSGKSFNKDTTRVLFPQGFTTCVQYLSPTKLLTLAPYGIGSNLVVKVTANGYTSSLTDATYSYYPPTIDQVCFEQISSDTVKIKLTGSNYGVSAPTGNLSITVNGTLCPDVVWTMTEISCSYKPTPMIANGCDTEGTTRRRQDNLGFQSAAGPIVLQLSQNGSTAQSSADILAGLLIPNSDNTRGSAEITIVGFNMGSSADKVYVEFPNSGYSPCVKRLSATQLLATVPAGYGTGHVTVRIGNYTSPKNKGTIFSYYRPEVYTISPLGRLPLTQNAAETTTNITIRGRYFGWRDSQPTIQLVTKTTTYNCSNTEKVQIAPGLTEDVTRGWVSDSEVFCQLKTIDTVGAGRIVVTVGGLSSDGAAYPVWFSFNTPRGIVLPSAPTNIRAAMVKGVAGNFLMTWAKPYNTGSGGRLAKIFTYQLQVSTDTSFKLLLEDKTIQDPTMQYTMGGCEVGKTYHIRIAAENDAGRGSWGRTSLVCIGLPSPPLNVAASVVGDREIKVTWTPPVNTGAGGNSVALQSYRVNFTGVSSTALVQKLVPGNLLEATVTAKDNVIKGVNYSIKVLSVNTFGSSGVSANAVYLAAAGPPGRVVGLQALSTQPNQFDIKFSKPSDTGTGGQTFPITSYDIAFSRNMFDPKFIASEVAGGKVSLYSVPGTVASPYSFMVPQTVGPNETCFFSARATSAAGSGPWNPTTAGNLLVAPAMPQNVSVTAVVGPAAAVNWSYPTVVANMSTTITDDLRNNLQSYEVQLSPYKDFNANVSTKIIPCTNVCNYSTSFTGLAVGQMYVVRIRAISKYGWKGAWSDLNKMTTMVGAVPPSAPQNLKLESRAGSRLASVSWALPADTGDLSQRFEIIGYHLQYSDAATFATPTTVKLGANARMYDFTNLNEGTTYYMRVAAESSIGLGAFSSTITVTLPYAPGPIEGLTAMVDGDNVRLTWNQPTRTIADTVTPSVVSAYTIETTSDAAPNGMPIDVQKDVNALQFVKTGLTRGHTYTFKVTAGNGGGFGSSGSASVNFYVAGAATAMPMSGPVSGGTMVTIVGRSIGTNSGAQPSAVFKKGSSSQTAQYFSQYEWDDAGSTFSVVFRSPVSPDGAAGGATVQASIRGETISVPFFYNALDSGDRKIQIAQILPNVLTQAGGTLKLTMRGLAYDDNVQTYTFTLGGKACSVQGTPTFQQASGFTIVSINCPTLDAASSSTSLSFKGTGGTGSATVNVIANTADQYVVDAYPQVGLTIGGNTVTIAARNFGFASSADVSISVGSTTLTTATGANIQLATSATGATRNIQVVTVEMPAQAASTLTGTEVTISSIAVPANTAKFHYWFMTPSPSIAKMLPISGTTGANTRVSLLLKGFADYVTSATDLRVTFGTQAAASTTLMYNHAGNVMLEVLTPTVSSDGFQTVTVTHATKGTLTATGPVEFNFKKAGGIQVTNYLPSGGSITGGAAISVRITGAATIASASATVTLPSGSVVSATVLDTSVDTFGNGLVLIQAPASNPTGTYEKGQATVRLAIGSSSTTFPFTYTSGNDWPGFVRYVQPLSAAPGSSIFVSVMGMVGVSSKSELIAMMGGTTPMTVTEVQSNYGQTTVVMTVPNYQPGQVVCTLSHSAFTNITASFSVNVAPAAGPMMKSVLPSAGYTSGGTKVSMTVSGIAAVSSNNDFQFSVFDGYSKKAATSHSYTQNNDGTFTFSAAMPAGSEGARVGLLTIMQGSPYKILPFKFTYVKEPTGTAVVESVSPTDMSINGGQEVTVRLSNYMVVTATTEVTVTVNQAPVTVKSVSSNPYYTTFTFTTTPNVVGSATVQIGNRNLATNTATYTAQYVDMSLPAVAWLYPSNSAAGTFSAAAGKNGIATIKLNNVPGTNPVSTVFVFMQRTTGGGSQVQLTVLKRDPVPAENAFYITFAIPYTTTAGAYRISLQSPSFKTSPAAPLEAVYTVSTPAPYLVNLKPNTVKRLTTNSMITVLGRNFGDVSNSGLQFISATVSGVSATVKSATSQGDSSEVVVQVNSPVTSAAGTSLNLELKNLPRSLTLNGVVTVTEPQSRISQITPSVIHATGGELVYAVVEDFPGYQPTTSDFKIYLSGDERDAMQVACSNTAEYTAKSYIGSSSGSSTETDSSSYSTAVWFVLPQLPTGLYTVTITSADDTVSASTTLTVSDLPVAAVLPMNPAGPTSGGTVFSVQLSEHPTSGLEPSRFSFFAGSVEGAVVSVSMDGATGAKVYLRTPTYLKAGMIDCVLRYTVGSNVKAFPFKFQYVDAESSGSVGMIASLSPSSVSEDFIMSGRKVTMRVLEMGSDITDADFIVSVNGQTVGDAKLVSHMGDHSDISFSVPMISLSSASQSLRVSLASTANPSVISHASLSRYRSQPYIKEQFPTEGKPGTSVTVTIANFPKISSALDVTAYLLAQNIIDYNSITLLSSSELETAVTITLPLSLSPGEQMITIYANKDGGAGTSSVTFSFTVRADGTPYIEFVTPEGALSTSFNTFYIGMANVDSQKQKFKVIMEGQAKDPTTTLWKNDGSNSTDKIVLGTVMSPFTIDNEMKVVVGEVQVSDKATGANTMKLPFTVRLYKNGNSGVVEQVGMGETVAPSVPVKVPYTGGVDVRYSIFKIYDDLAVSTSNLILYLDGWPVTLTDVSSNTQKTVVTFKAPPSLKQFAEGYLVPNNDWNKRVFVRLEYDHYCDYNSFCGEDGVNAGMLKLMPPGSRMTCEKMYCMSELKTAELQYTSTSSAYTGAQAPVELSISHLPTSDPLDLTIKFGDLYGTVTAVNRQSETLASVFVTTPHMLDASSVTATLMTQGSVAGGARVSVSFPFAFYSKPSGDSSVSLSTSTGTEGTVVTATLTNFPITTSTQHISIAVSGSVVTLTPTRIISSDAASTVILFSMYSPNTGTVTLYFSSTITGTNQNTGSASFIYSAIDPQIRQFYPAYGSSAGGYEMYIAMVGFPLVASASDVSVSFGGITTVTASTLLSSDQDASHLSAINRVKVVVPSMQIYGGMMDVTVTAGGSSATFQFYYSPVSVATVDAVEPPSGAISGGYPVQLHITDFPVNSASKDVIVMFDNIRVVGTVDIVQSDGSATITAVAPAFSTARNVKCEVYVAYDVMFTNTIGYFSFMYTSNPVKPSPAFMSVAGGVATTFVVQDISWTTTAADWSVSIGGKAAIVSSVAMSAGNTSIVAIVPAGTVSGAVPGALTYIADASMYDFTFTYTDPPSILKVSPQNFGPTSGGTVLTVCLKDFPVVYDSGILVVTVGSTAVKALVKSSSVAETIIEFATPAAAVGRAVVTVTVSTYTATFNFDYRLAGYAVDLVYPMGAYSTQLSTVNLNIRGYSLSKASEPRDFQVRVGNMYGYVANVKVMDIAEGTASIMAYLPSMPVGAYRISVMQGAEMSEFRDLFVVSSGYGRIMNMSSTDAAEGTGTTQVTVYNLPVSSNLDVVAKYGDYIAPITAFSTDNAGGITYTIQNPTNSMLRGSVAAPLQLMYPGMSVLATAGADCASTIASPLQSCQPLYASPFRLNAAPGFTSLMYDAGRSAVRIVFDQPTNKASITDPTITDCGQVIFGSAFGAGSRCIWEDSSTYVINLGSGSMVTTGSPLKVVAGKVAAASGNSAYSAGVSGLGYSCMANPAPLIFIDMPKELGPCADLPLSAVGTTPGANYQYMWSCTNDAVLNEALSLVNAAEAVVSGTNLITTGKTYNLELKVKIGDMTYGTATHSITKRPLPVATMHIEGEFVYIEGELIKLDAVADFSGCPQTTGNLVYSWMVDGKTVSTSTQYSTISTSDWVVGLSGGDLHTLGTAGAAVEGKTVSVTAYISGDMSIVGMASVDVFVISKASVLRAPVMQSGLGVFSAGKDDIKAICDAELCTASCIVVGTGMPCGSAQFKDAVTVKTGEPITLSRAAAPGAQRIIVSSTYGPVLKSSVHLTYNPAVKVPLILDLVPGYGIMMSEDNTKYITTADSDFSFVASLKSEAGQYVGAATQMTWSLMYGSTTISSGNGTGTDMELVIPFAGKALTAGVTYSLKVQYIPNANSIYRTVEIMVSSPPTRGACSVSAVTTTTSNPITVTCANFADDLHGSSRSAGMLHYEFGYVFTKDSAGNVMTNQQMVFFSKTTSSSSTLCLPAGTFNIMVRVTNAQGAATYNTAGVTVVTTDAAYLLTAAASQSMQSLGGVNGGTVAGAFQAYGQLARIDLLTQCAYVYASGGRSTTAGAATDMDALIGYTANAARFLGTTADASAGISTLRATSAYTAFNRADRTQQVIAATQYANLADTALHAAKALNDNNYVSAMNGSYATDTLSGLARSFNQSQNFASSGAATNIYNAIDWVSMAVAYWRSASPALSEAFGFVGARIGADTTMSSSDTDVDVSVAVTMRNYDSPVTPKPTLTTLTLGSTSWQTAPAFSLATVMNITTPTSLAWMYSNVAASSPIADVRIVRDAVNWNPNHKKISSVYGVTVTSPKHLVTGTSVAGKFTVTIPLAASSLTAAQNATLGSSVSCTMLDRASGTWMRSDASNSGTCRVQAIANNATVTCACPVATTDVVAEYVLIQGCDLVWGSGVVNDCTGTCGGTAAYDACGVCAGDNSTCKDCSGVPNGGRVNDACGVCGGDGSSCKGCDGVPNSGVLSDVCGVCGGDNSTCRGCDGVPNGKVYDACGECGGNGTKCAGCDLVPHSGKKFDKCMICGGNSNVSYDKTCIGRIITSNTDTTDSVVMTGRSLTKYFKAKASDNGNYLSVTSFTKASVDNVCGVKCADVGGTMCNARLGDYLCTARQLPAGFTMNSLVSETCPEQCTPMPLDSSQASASYVLPAFSSKQVGENVTGTFTWTPRTSGNYKLCLELRSYLTNITVERTCYTIYSVFCEHITKSAETLETVAAKYSTSWRTLWWLNPSIGSQTQSLAEGTRVQIGRTYTMPRNTTLATVTNIFGTTYDQLMEYNPLKINYLQGGRQYFADTNEILGYRVTDKPVIDLQYTDYGNQVEYAGVEFCLKSSGSSAR